MEINTSNGFLNELLSGACKTNKNYLHFRKFSFYSSTCPDNCLFLNNIKKNRIFQKEMKTLNVKNTPMLCRKL